MLHSFITIDAKVLSNPWERVKVRYSTRMVLSFSFCKFDMKGAFRSCRPIRKKIIAKLKQGANCASQSVSKPRLTFERIVICLVWMEEIIMLYGPLALGKTIEDSHWLTALQQAIEENRLKLVNRIDVVFDHGNARPHSLSRRQKLKELKFSQFLSR